MSLKQKVLQGTFWTFTEQLSVKGLSFIVQIVLARLLLPEDFGLIAMVIIFIGIGNAIVDSGMNQSLIRLKKPSNEDFCSVFYLNVVVSLLVYLTIYIAAPHVSVFYNQPELTLVLRFLALVIPIRSFMSVQSAILTIKMDFKSQMLIQLPSLIVGAILAIYLAYNDYGVWSLVGMQLVIETLVTIQFWIYSDWRPKLIFNRERVKFHFDFGSKLMLATFVRTISNDIYTILIGKYFNSAILGIYNRASVFQKFLPLLLGTAVSRVTYPLFSKLTDNIGKLKLAFYEINKLVYFIYLPIIFFLIFKAENIIVILLTDKWIGIVPIFQILCFGGLMQPIQYYSSSIIEAFGDSTLVLKINVVSRTITLFGAFLIIKYGIYYLVIFEAVNLILISLICMFYSGKFINYSILQQIKDISLEFIISSTLAFLYFLILGIFDLSYWVDMILYFILFISTYFGICYFFKFYASEKILNDILKPFFINEKNLKKRT